MHFSRVRVPADRLDPEKLSAFLTGDGYALHQLLWRLFPDDPDAPRDFLYRRETENGWPMFYMVSARMPRPVDGLFAVETKPYAPRLSNGQRLSFSLRANPVVTRKDREGGKRSRHDVVMDAKRRRKSSGEAAPAAEVVEAAGREWLGDRAEKSGFSFDYEHVRIDAYLQHRIAKPGARKSIRFSTLDFSGILTVRDPERFIRTLSSGIGPAKAFGCGLMLVRKI